MADESLIPHQHGSRLLTPSSSAVTWTPLNGATCPTRPSPFRGSAKNR